MSPAANAMMKAWVMKAVGRDLEYAELPMTPPAAGEAIVEVAGCGLCHTDLSFLDHGVKTRAELPLVLGHEIAGIVREAGDGVDSSLLDRPVIVPAVLSCGECEVCREDQRRICAAQIMPGNDRHGGFASHVTVPARYLCPVDDALLETHELWQLSIVSDAVTTPFQAIKRSKLRKGDLAVFIGAGGIGIHGVQIAAAAGAAVVALDVDPAKLEIARAAGASAVIDVRDKPFKEIRKQVAAECKQAGARRTQWKIYETSGTKSGQETAFGLINHGARVAIVGFTMDRLEIRLSNLMAFDATVTGNWGCDPALYPEVLSWVADGRIKLAPYVERFPLAEINRVIDSARRHKLEKRAVLTP